MIGAYFWACGIFRPELPPSMSDVQKRARLVSDIDAIILVPINVDLQSGGNGQLADFSNNTKIKILKDIAEKSKSYVLIEDNNNVLANIALRLWAGCTETAKSIALKTLNGDNTPQGREMSFLQIDLFSKLDLVYSAGAEAAPSLKKLRREYYSFNGVPPNSVVRKYPNDYLKNE